MSKKKIVLSVIVLILLAFIFILPVRCTPVMSGFDESSDALRPFQSRTCYAIYHPKFWTDEKDRPIEFERENSFLGVWFRDQTFGYFSAHPMENVRETIFHHQ